MAHIAAFSKLLTYQAGGAELSTRELLLQESERGNRIQLIAAAGASFRGKKLSPITFPPGWGRTDLSGGKIFSRFSYVEYMLNRTWLKQWFASLEADELWTYGTWGPAAAIGFSGKVRFFVRSETDLGIVGNYFSGGKRLMKALYTASEVPAIWLYRRDLKAALEKAEVVANSNYIASRALALYGIKAEVCYPHIDIGPLREKILALPNDPKWVVFVGDAPYKGIGIVQNLARRMPDVRFKIFSRFVDHEHRENNILWCPWTKETWRLYDGARMVVVPSQWEEAYGRVAREAYLLDIPVLASNIGGLPEAVEGRADALVDDYQNVAAWEQALRKSLNAPA